MSRRGLMLFLALCVIWGIPYLLIKVAVREVTPATLVFFRTAIGSLLLLPVAVYRGGLRQLIPHWKPIVAFTVVELAIPWYLLSSAEQRLPSSLSGLLIAAVPLVGAVLAAATGNAATERLGPARLLGLLVGIGGVALLVGLDVRSADLFSVGEIGVVVIGYATGPWIIGRYFVGLPTLGIVTASLATCAIAYAPIAAIELPAHWPAGEVTASIAVLGVICTAVAFLLAFGLVAEVGAVRATVITYVNPAVAVLLGVAILGEPFTLAIAGGFVLIIAGSVLATRRSANMPPAGDPERPARPA